ncbi:MAG: hypothetical protein CMK74_02245 [Pseudomonadales bacterium]|nr:hypothetical protein [Pseudomonadales bacterium]
MPGSTLKWARNDGTEGGDSLHSTARLFIPVDKGEQGKFLQSIPPESQPIAKVLCGVAPGGSAVTGFIDFLLTAANESFQERTQIVHTLSDNFVVYTFGQQAAPFQYSGWLLNTYQDDQRIWMLRAYQDILRASQLARRQKLVSLRYDSVIVTGILLNHQQNLSSNIANAVQFSFTLLPTQYSIFTPAVVTPTVAPGAVLPKALVPAKVKTEVEKQADHNKQYAKSKQDFNKAFQSTINKAAYAGALKVMAEMKAESKKDAAAALKARTKKAAPKPPVEPATYEPTGGSPFGVGRNL